MTHKHEEHKPKKAAHRKKPPAKPKKGGHPTGSAPSDFETRYHEAGIGGFKPTVVGAHIFAFDGASTGKLDHLFCYVSGKGECSVLRHEEGKFSAIYKAEKGGIGGWNFSEYLDRAIAYDYDHSGKMDHVLCWRCPNGIVWIMKHDGRGSFTPVYKSDGGGLGGFDFDYPWDRVLSFDYDRSGKCDALVVYRRYSAGFCVIKNFEGTFVPVYKEWCWGIGGYITSYEGDYVFAYDWTHTGYKDHLLFINNSHLKKEGPWSGVVARQGNLFVTVWSSKKNLAGFPTTENKMLIGCPLDYDSSGTENYFGLFHIGHGGCWIVVSPESNEEWEKVYEQNEHGIGTCDLKADPPRKVFSDAFELNDRIICFDYDSSGCNDHFLIYRRSTGAVWIMTRKGHRPTPRDPFDGVAKHAIDWTSQGSVPLYAPPSDPTFTTVYKTSEGVAGFELSGAHDKCFAFDFDHTGKTDHLCLYSPGSGSCVIARNDGQNQFQPVYAQNGIGEYNLLSAADDAFAFDFEHSGRLDYICAYRPGTGIFWILRNDRGAFTPVVSDGDPRNNTPGAGIGGYRGHTAADRAFAFDYSHSGRLDHICLYRPGAGVFWILQNNQGSFTAVFSSNEGIPGYDFKSPQDKVIALDWDHSGKLDHLLLYRPGERTVAIARNDGRKFTRVYHRYHPGEKKPWADYQAAIGGFDLENKADLAFAFDYHSSGKQDHIVFYRPGSGMVFVIQQLSNGCSPVYQGYGKGLKTNANQRMIHTTDYQIYKSQGKGLGGYDLSASEDRCIGFDFNSTGKNDHIVAFRPGKRVLWVVRRTEPPYPVAAPRA